MKHISLRWALCAGPALTLALACGSTDDDGLFGGSGSTANSGGNSASGGSAAQAGTPATGGGNTAGQPNSGGSSNSGGTAGTPATGGASGSGGTAGSGGTVGSGGSPGYTLDNVCAKFSAALCSMRKSCCTSSFGFDEGACLKNETADCEANVKEVSAGNRSFNPQNIEVCLTQAAPLLQECNFHGGDYANFFEVQNSCRGIFDSKKQPGSSCSEADDCAAAPTPHGVSGCGSNSKQCFQTEVVQSGNKCDSNVYCAKGTRCINTGSGSVCTPVKAGDSCSGNSSSCGLGLYCANNQCQAPKSSGVCYSSYYCDSFACQSNYQCAPLSPVVSQRSCGKS